MHHVRLCPDLADAAGVWLTMTFMREALTWHFDFGMPGCRYTSAEPISSYVMVRVLHKYNLSRKLNLFL